MYCKGCNSLLENDNPICPKCGLDNNAVTEETTEIYLNKISNPRDNKHKKNPLPIIVCLVLSLTIIIISIYIFKDSKKDPKEIPQTTTTTAISKIKKFKFKSIILEYPKDRFGTSTNTIFLKDNNNINIVLKNITLEEYNTIINSNDLLDDYLGEVPSKTFASDNSYSHVFTVKDEYYLIEVNYNDITASDQSNTESIQLELSKIIKSLKIK